MSQRGTLARVDVQALVFALLLAGSAALAQDAKLTTIAEEIVPGRVTEVRGADSLVVVYEGTSHRFRLEGVGVVRDRPGLAARAAKILRERLVGKTVRICIRGYVESGSVPVGAVLVGGTDVRLELVSQGLVAYCPRHVVEVGLQDAERQAKEAKRGVWADPPSPAADPCNGAV